MEEQWLAENEAKKRSVFEELAEIHAQKGKKLEELAEIMAQADKKFEELAHLNQEEQASMNKYQHLETEDQHIRNLINFQRQPVDKISPDVPVYEIPDDDDDDDVTHQHNVDNDERIQTQPSRLPGRSERPHIPSNTPAKKKRVRRTQLQIMIDDGHLEQYDGDSKRSRVKK